MLEHPGWSGVLAVEEDIVNGHQLILAIGDQARERFEINSDD